MLFIRLEGSKKLGLVKSIVENLESLVRNMISFKAIICLFETPLGTEAQNIIITCLSKIDSSYYLTHTRYLKVLESFITNLSEARFQFIINIITLNTYDFLQSKQGYFLIRKVLKHIKQENLQNQIADSVIKDLKKFSGCHTGLLLLQCLIKYFSKAEVLVDSTQASNMSFNKKIIIQALSIEHKKSEPKQSSSKLNQIQSKFLNTPNPAVFMLFKAFVSEILLSFSIQSNDSEQVKGNIKVFELLISNCGDSALKHMLSLFSNQFIDKQIKLINEIIKFEGSLNCISKLIEYDLTAQDCSFAKFCSELNSKQIPEKFHNEWRIMKAKLINPQSIPLKNNELNSNKSSFKKGKKKSIISKELKKHDLQDPIESTLDHDSLNFDDFIMSNPSFFHEKTKTIPSNNSKIINYYCIQPQIISRSMIQPSYYEISNNQTNFSAYPSNQVMQLPNYYTGSNNHIHGFPVGFNPPISYSMPLTVQPLYYNSGTGMNPTSYNQLRKNK